MHENSLTTAPTHASLGERVRSAPVGLRAAAGSAAAVVALLGAGLGGYGIGQAIGDDADPAPASLTRDSDPTGRDAEPGLSGGEDVTLTRWYAVPVTATDPGGSPLRAA